MDRLIKESPYLEAADPRSVNDFKHAGFDRRREYLRRTSPRWPESSAYSFPSGVASIGDMALFGGLLCASGEEEGCESVRCSQGKTGQFWRSPSHVDRPPAKPDEMPFSGDQFKGVVAYFIGNTSNKPCPVGSQDNQTDAERFTRWLNFINGQLSPVPSPALPLDFGYHSCIESQAKKAVAGTCLLQGQEWTWLNLLARRYGVSDIPGDLSDPSKTYGYHMSHLDWLAAFPPLGDDSFMTHLVGIEIYLLNRLGLSNATSRRAAAILAARQPNNPFFVYLHLGRSSQVLEMLRKMCFFDVPPSSKDEWTWQSDEKKDMWKLSKGWDCIFMFNNVLNQ